MEVEYTRKAGRQLTYRICADEHGRFTVHLGAKQLLRGRDRLSAAGGREGGANKRKAAGAVAQAKVAIERLCLMSET